MSAKESRASRELAEGIAARLRAAGHRALFAGGCVRDLLLGDEPEDYDIATSARPEEVMAIFPRTAPVGAAFGVVLVMPDGRIPFEVATFRRDLGYTDRRRPDAVEFAGEREDAQRRDFTINGLFLDPQNSRILDFVGGQADLEQGIIRAIGDPTERIAEDRLRMLRAIRFAARYHFRLERRTLAAVEDHATTVIHVSGERIRDELLKMLTRGDAAVAVELLDASGLLRVVLPEVAALKDVAGRAAELSDDPWDQTLLMLAGLKEPSATLALAVLLRRVGQTEFSPAQGGCDPDAIASGLATTTGILERLRISNRASERVSALIRDQHQLNGVLSLPLSGQKRFLRQEHIAELLELHRIDALTSGRSLAAYAHSKMLIETLGPDQLRPPALLTGDDLRALGLTPGPTFRQILYDIETAQLDGRLCSREAALARVREDYLVG